MKLILYNNMSDNATLSKTISEIVVIDNVVLLDDTDILNPVFRLKIPNDITAFNYCHCDIFGRYYYVRNITVETGGIYRLECAVDVLMTYREQILNTSAIIMRGGTNYNVLVNDGQKIPQANTAVVNKKFVGGELLNSITSLNNSFLLTCYGGVGL